MLVSERHFSVGLFNFFISSLWRIERVPDTITSETRPAITAEGNHLLHTLHLSLLLMLTSVQALITTLPQLVPCHISPHPL